MNWRRLILYLLLNAIVSAVVTLSVLAVWDATHPRLAAIATPSPAPQPPLQATQTAAVQPLPSATPTIYEVKGGDTLGSIALAFDVSVEDIMAANGLADANTLNVGQTLVIPVGGLVRPTATAEALGPLASPVAPPSTSTVTVQSEPPQLAIRSVTDAGNLATEKVTLINLGGPVNLAGWSLHDDQGNVYTFPVVNLFQGGAISIHTGVGRDTVTDLFWGQPGPMWQSGETATLGDADGKTHTTFVIP